MSNGKGTRWNLYQGITKQESLINGERLLDRTVRQIKERTNDKIIIFSCNENHVNNNSTRLVPSSKDHFKKLLGYEFIDEPVSYLYGDTYYPDETIEQIINDDCKDITFYGDENAIVGIKAVNFELLKQVLDQDNDPKTNVYHICDSIMDKRKFVIVTHGYTNINTPEDYIKLVDKTRNRTKE